MKLFRCYIFRTRNASEAYFSYFSPFHSFPSRDSSTRRTIKFLIQLEQRKPPYEFGYSASVRFDNWPLMTRYLYNALFI